MKYLSGIRKKQGLTQADLADLVGVGMNSIARYERGEVQPSVEIAQLIAGALNVRVDELLNGPTTEDWELRLVVSKAGQAEKGVIDMTTEKSSAVLNIGDTAMAITLSANYELWEDDAKFECLIEQLRRKRATGLKTHREDW